jgi:hypothetical protein
MTTINEEVIELTSDQEIRKDLNLKEKVKFNRNNHFILVDKKLNCKNCTKSYEKSVSSNILKKHVIKKHTICEQMKINEFFKAS